MNDTLKQIIEDSDDIIVNTNNTSDNIVSIKRAIETIPETNNPKIVIKDNNLKQTMS